MCKCTHTHTHTHTHMRFSAIVGPKCRVYIPQLRKEIMIVKSYTNKIII